MILYYALGGGYGHITRAISVIHTLGIKEEVLLLTSLENSLDDTPFKILPPNIIPIDCPQYDYSQKLKLNAFIRGIIDHHDVSQAYIDTFPMGIFGELTQLHKQVPLTHIARVLKWQNYQKYTKNNTNRFQISYMVETLYNEHQSWLSNHSEHVFPLPLENPSYNTRKIASAINQATGRELRNSWLVVHSGPQQEIDELLYFVKEVQEIENCKPPVLLISPGEYETTSNRMDLDLSHCSLYPAYPLFPLAKRIFTGCGYNIMSELSIFSKKHHFIPFDRLFDDQHFRAANCSRQQRRLVNTLTAEIA